MCEFITDIKTRFIREAASLGISPATAAMLLACIDDTVADYAGDRVYIGKGEEAASEMSARNRAIIRDHKAGERVALLARRYGVSRVRIHQIIKG